jgi:hypothetical protein
MRATPEVQDIGTAVTAAPGTISIPRSMRGLREKDAAACPMVRVDQRMWVRVRPTDLHVPSMCARRSMRVRPNVRRTPAHRRSIAPSCRPVPNARRVPAVRDGTSAAGAPG